MDLPAYAVTNKGAGATISASSTDAAYPLANLVDGILGKPARAASATAWDIEYDMLSAVQLNGWGVLAHNFTSSMTAVLKAGASPTPTAVIHTFAYLEGNMNAVFTAASHRYWRLEITDTNSEVLQIGEMFPMLHTLFPRATRFGGHPRRRERRQIVHTTIGGVPSVTHFYTRRTPEYRFRLKDSQLDAFDALDKLLLGQLRPFCFIPDTDDDDVIFGRMTSSHFEPVEMDEPTAEPVSDYVFSIAAESPGKRILT